MLDELFQREPICCAGSGPNEAGCLEPAERLKYLAWRAVQFTAEFGKRCLGPQESEGEDDIKWMQALVLEHRRFFRCGCEENLYFRKENVKWCGARQQGPVRRRLAGWRPLALPFTCDTVHARGETLTVTRRIEQNYSVR
jgi:hypothetical protein